MRRQYDHSGTAFLEVYQNCLIFNDGAFQHLADREVRDDNVLILEHGKPMIFGKEKDKGLRIDASTPQVVSLEKDYSQSDLVVHDENDRNLAGILANLTYAPDFPTPVGVLYQEEEPTYDDLLVQQIEQAKEKLGKGDLMKLIRGADTWEVD